jgi:hypothetical protein
MLRGVAGAPQLGTKGCVLRGINLPEKNLGIKRCTWSGV